MTHITTKELLCLVYTTIQITFLFFAMTSSSSSSSSSCPSLMEEAVLEEGFCAYSLFQTSGSRSVIAAGTTNLIVLERSLSQVSWIYDSDGDGLVDARKALASEDGLNHGLAIHDGYLYASSDTTVYRWPYQLGDDIVGGGVELVVINISADGMGGAPGGHTTRTLVFDSTGRLYVSVGSAGNVDTDSYRSRIRRCDLSSTLLPIDFDTCEVFADGLRNEVGLAFNKHGVLWGVENGADQLERSDLGGDIHTDNPAEELNRFPEEHTGLHWGYPYCWSEFDLPTTGLGRGTQWAWPSFLGATVNGTEINDEYCRNKTLPAELSMQAHSAPLGITFYNYTDEVPDDCAGVFPKEMDGYAFIAFHGSWNREVPTGYKVVYVPMNEQGRLPQGEEARDLLYSEGGGATWSSGFRPVDVDFDACGRLIVTSDGSNGAGSEIVRVSYQASIAPTLSTATVTPGTSPTTSPSIVPTLPTTTMSPINRASTASAVFAPVQVLLLMAVLVIKLHF
jgi:glucose/arabinose dehydrogenase